MKKFVVIIALAMAVVIVPPAMAGEKTLTFQWEYDTAPIEGFRLYYSTQSGQFSAGEFWDIPYNYGSGTFQSEQTITVPDGTEEEYFFVITAYDYDGNESAPSNEVSAILDFKAPSAPFNFEVTVTAAQ